MSQAQKTAKVLLIQGDDDTEVLLPGFLGDAVDLVRVSSVGQARTLLDQGGVDYLLVSPGALAEPGTTTLLSDDTDLLETVSQGVGIVNSRGELDWENPKLLSFSDEVRAFVRKTCTDVFSKATAQPRAKRTNLSAGQRSTFQAADGGLFELTATPILNADRKVTQVVAVVWDLTHMRRRQEQLAAIDFAGRELLRLDTEQVSRLDTQERLALLEQKISRYLRELMRFDNFSIRILDKRSNKLELVLSWGLSQDTRPADIYALPEGNGICGYVAFHGKSHICPDISRDSRYFKGIEGAKSSLSVPLLLNKEVIGVLNVESRRIAAFDQESRQLAERFGRDIAVALHILDLLMTERYTTTGKLGSDVMAEISGPVNDILTDVENLIEDYIGYDDLRHRLNKITSTAVGIRDAIKRVTSPQRGLIGVRSSGLTRYDPILSGKRVLIADDETLIRDTVRDVMASYGCQVTLVDDGDRAIEQISKTQYDLVLSDIRMPGRDGYQVFAAAKDAHKNTPVILMTGFGYDPNHAIVRARREGLAAVLFKPFKVDQLLSEIRSALRNAAS